MYELTALFWYKPIFLTELIIAEALFTVRLKRRSFFYLRLLGSLAIDFAAAFAFPIVAYNAVWCSFMFLCLFAVTVMTLKLRYNESWLNILFCAIAGYTLQHIAYETYDLIVASAELSEGASVIYGSTVGGIYEPFKNPVTAIVYLFDFIIIYWLAFVCFGLRLQNNEGLNLKNLSLTVLVVLVVLIDIILSSIVTYYAEQHFDRTYTIMLCIFNILCCVLALFIQFEMSRRKKLESEVYVLHSLRAQEEKQYEASKENIDLINQKVHDLKHQIRALGSAGSLNSETLKEMEEMISVYDSAVKTGNNAADVILTEKSHLCRKADIKLTCVVDGKQLAFMSESDIYSLFGNILDNAIEAVSSLDKDRRAVSISAKRAHDFLIINAHNYFDGKLTFAEGLPLTTKKDKQYHGYGMKSVKMICEKYGGDLSVVANDGIFMLNILFVIGENGASDGEIKSH